MNKTQSQLEMEIIWKREASPTFKELHSLCSYLAMFPPYVPSHYIKKYTNEGELVYDPFSGRGTTPLEAKRLKRRTISNDLSPLAFVLTKSKMSEINIKKVYERVDYHKNNYKIWIKQNQYKLRRKEHDEIKVFFSSNNLKQMFYLREILGKNFKKLSKTDNFILAIALGITHGKTRADGTTSNFSVSMPNGYSMAPGYAKKYIAKNNLIKPKTDIFQQIKARASKKVPISNEGIDHKVIFGDALNSSKIINESPKLIFTSPPYLNIVKYVSQNWIRFWILGFNKEDTNKKIVDDYHNLEMYKLFMRNFMNEMKKLMNKDSKLIMVIGDVNKISVREIIKELSKDCEFKYVSKPEEHILKRKLSSQMGKEKNGKATPRDWVFILERKWKNL